MAEAIDYYFTVISPNVYLGHETLMEIARRHGLQVNFRPVTLGKLWEQSGSVPLPQRSAMRQRYRFVELQRHAELRKVKLNLKPAFFPVNPTTADLSAAAIVLGGGDPDGFIFAACRAVWAEEKNISDEDVVAELLTATGHDAEAVLAAAGGEDAANAVAANSEAASAADAIGVPAYVYKGETFWGQDKLELLENMIVSGREAYHAI
ncbi:MAG: 2-hydroxychromene-2-carboxylate isomerase [Salaquimonas sp.]|jgi:2-hydroxychromene-2-carboxylate isomerase|nr:2-hydroxychromene-2-carboxylate isomerase [Salaquimonas sp.]